MAKAELTSGAAAFLAGIFVASFLSGPFLAGFLILCGLAALAAGAETRPALLSMGAAFLGALYLIFFMNLQSAGRGLAYGEPAELRGVVREVRMSGDTDVIEVSLLPPQGGRLRVISGRDSGLNYGDELYLAGIPEPPSSRLADPVMFFPRFKVTAKDRGNPVQARLLAIRAGFLDRLHLALRPDSAALAGGLTLGAKDGFSAELKEKMRASGTTHLVALSGYNVSILALAVSSALGAWFRRRTTFLLTVLAICLFVVMTGAEASLVRAALMGILALLASQIGRQYDISHAIVCAALLMALWDPRLLYGDLGFQLSFLALLGVAYLSPVLAGLFPGSGRGSWLNWRENLLLTVSAQLAVLPLLLLNFREFSLAAVGANALILGLVPLTMLLVFLTGLAGIVHAYFGTAIGWLAELPLSFELATINVFSALRLPVVLPAGWNWIFPAIYYALLAAGVAWLGKRTRSRHA